MDQYALYPPLTANLSYPPPRPSPLTPPPCTPLFHAHHSSPLTLRPFKPSYPPPCSPYFHSFYLPTHLSFPPLSSLLQPTYPSPPFNAAPCSPLFPHSLTSPTLPSSPLIPPPRSPLLPAYLSHLRSPLFRA